jgi:hypothetical protein
MATQLKHFKVVVASPSDVKSERECLKSVVEFVNRIARQRGFCLDLYQWETDVHPQFHALGPQGAIDDALSIETCDVFICIFWSRFGTPINESDSGTQHELTIADKTWRQHQRPLIMLYFNDEPFSPKNAVEADQQAAVFRLREKLPSEAFYGSYKGTEEFKSRITNDLTLFVEKLDPSKDGFRYVVEAPSSPPHDQQLPRQLWEKAALKDIPLYTFCGLQRTARDEDVLQDFSIDPARYMNPNPVSSFWADTYRGGSISAIVEQEEPPHLRIEYDNKPASFPCTITIRPIGESAITSRGRRAICFQARSVTETPAETDAASDIFVGVRLVNGFCQHWAYGPAHRYKLLNIPHEWTEIVIPIAEAQWWLFTSDGNTYFGPDEYNFSIIAEVVFEVGSYGLDRPGPGRGTLLVRSIRIA